MKYLAAFLWLAGFFGEPLAILPPVYPPEAISGGTVVAALHLFRGSVASVEILSGAEPFVSYALPALYRWRFVPHPGRADVLVVVRFRQPDRFSMGGLAQTVPPEMTVEPGLPYPTEIVDPAYSTEGPAAGSVVLQLNISPTGYVLGVRVIKPLGALTETSAIAALNWHFQPAMGAYGGNVPSQALAVMVFSPSFF